MARAPAPAQPEGFKAGLFDVVFTATSRRRGIIPDVDALSGNTAAPWIGCAFVVLVLLIVFPQIALWLPDRTPN